MARGRGIRGIAQPVWRRRLGGGVTLVRPLLDSTKEECLALCERFDVPWACDPGNEDPAKARGHLRREVLPHLLDRWPAIVRNATRLADEALVAVDAMDRLARARLGPPTARRWTRDLCRAADPTLVAWAIRAAAMDGSAECALAVPRVTWERIARAACDRRLAPRHFALGRTGCGGRCEIRASEVLLSMPSNREVDGAASA